MMPDVAAALSDQLTDALGALLPALDRAGVPAPALHAALVGVLLRQLFRLHAEARGLLPPRPPRSWRALAPPALRAAPVPDQAVASALRRLTHIGDAPVPYRALAPQQLGAAYQTLSQATLRRVQGRLHLQPSTARRRRGRHYTPRALTAPLVRRTLAPLLRGPRSDRVPTAAQILGLRVCDPAMGAGAFLAEAARQLAAALEAAWAREAHPAPAGSALRAVMTRCLRGVDRDRVAVWLARRSLWLAAGAPDLPLDAFDGALREGDALTEQPPFRWRRAFPSVWRGGRGGFDAVLGNPPFGGQKTIADGSGAAYIRQLQARWPHAHGSADLCAYFFLQGVALLRPGGTLGFISTNTVSQGNTRLAGLKHLICVQGARIFAAEVSYPWPGAGANVTVSSVMVCRGEWDGPCLLDGAPVAAISSHLTAGPEQPEPHRLAESARLGFEGSKLAGTGFVLTPAEAGALLRAEPRNAAIIKPYIGGRELNTNATLDAAGMVCPQRWVIDFADRPLAEARRWPALLSIVRQRVKPDRDTNRRRARREGWWKFGEQAAGLYASLDGLPRCFAMSRVTKHLLISPQPTDRIFSEALTVFAVSEWWRFAVLQSRVHACWAWRFTATMKTDLRYSLSRCLRTFPFPRPTAPQQQALGRAGEALHQQRAALQRARRVGLTRLWNHVVDEATQDDAEIVALRGQRDALDALVLASYGWADLPLGGARAAEEIVSRLRRLNAQRAVQGGRYSRAQQTLEER